MANIKKKGFLGTPNNPYAKTELCKNYPNCRFGDLCAFAHGEEDLRCKTLHEMQMRGKIPCAQKYRCYPCMNFVSTGACPYRHRCVFLHDPRIISDEKPQIYARPGEATFRASSSKYDMIQWPANKQKFDENIFINTTGDDVVEYTAPDQHAFSDSRLPWTIFCIWSGFVEELVRLKKYHEDTAASVPIIDSDPSIEFFIHRTADLKEVKVHRLVVFLELSNEKNEYFDYMMKQAEIRRQEFVVEKEEEEEEELEIVVVEEEYKAILNYENEELESQSMFNFLDEFPDDLKEKTIVLLEEEELQRTNLIYKNENNPPPLFNEINPSYTFATSLECATRHDINYRTRRVQANN